VTGGPDEGPAAGLPAVLRRINAAHGTAFRLTGRYAHGEQGAFRLRDATGGRYVLKWAPEAAGLGPPASGRCPASSPRSTASWP
jgi:hypothetical protein